MGFYGGAIGPTHTAQGGRPRPGPLAAPGSLFPLPHPQAVVTPAPHFLGPKSLAVSSGCTAQGQKRTGLSEGHGFSPSGRPVTGAAGPVPPGAPLLGAQMPAPPRVL